MKSLKISELKRGQKVYERQYGQSIEMIVTKGSHRKNGGWRAVARCTNLERTRVNLFELDGARGYGPRLYDAPAYFRR